MGTAGAALSELSGIIFVVNTPELALPDDYPRVLADLKAQIRSAQWTAARVVNTQVIELYWAIERPSWTGRTLRAGAPKSSTSSPSTSR